MFGLFGGSRKRSEQRERELSRDIKVMESQSALLNAATQTADAANVVTHRLKSRLEDSIAQFENTARIMNDALIICDLSGAIQAFNPAAEVLFEMTSAEVRETFIGDILKTNDPLVTGADVWAMLDKTSGADEMVGMRPDGRPFRVDVNHTQLDRSDGTSIVLLVLRDLRPSSEAKSYRSMFESSFDGILVVKDNKIVAANPAVSYLFGYTTEELLAKSLDHLIFSMDTPRIEVPDSPNGLNITVDAVHQNGQQMEVYFTTTTIWWNAEPASLITIRDMTPIRDAVAERDADKPKMICCYDSDYKITFANSLFANHYGSKPSILRGLDIRSLMGEEERSLFQMHVNGLSAKEPTRRMQMQKMLSNGAASLLVWSDHISYDGDEVEYQRIGQDISKTLTNKA